MIVFYNEHKSFILISHNIFIIFFYLKLFNNTINNNGDFSKIFLHKFRSIGKKF